MFYLILQAVIMKFPEDWVSGLNQRFTKPPTGKTVHEFESHILRQKN